MKKTRFYIGQYVVVKAVCKMRYGDDLRLRATSVPCSPFEGLIVGARRKMLGKFIAGNSMGYEGDYEPARLAADGSVLVWLVARSMTNIPAEVLDADVRASQSQMCPPDLPWTWRQPPPPLTSAVRKMLSDEAKKMPRDAKGRFLKPALTQTPPSC